MVKFSDKTIKLKGVIMEEEKYTLYLETGEIIDTTIEGYFDFKGKNYIVLTDDNSDDVYVYIMKDAGDAYELVEIEDDDELEAVFLELERIVEEQEGN